MRSTACTAHSGGGDANYEVYCSSTVTYSAVHLGMIEAAVEHRQNQRISYSVAYYAYCGKLLYSTVLLYSSFVYNSIVSGSTVYLDVVKAAVEHRHEVGEEVHEGASMRGAWRMDVLHSCTRGHTTGGTGVGEGRRGTQRVKSGPGAVWRMEVLHSCTRKAYHGGEQRGRGKRGGDEVADMRAGGAWRMDAHSSAEGPIHCTALYGTVMSCTVLYCAAHGNWAHK